MSKRDNIQEKLQKFGVRFYLNELIKGLIMFFSIGLLYLSFTLFVEYFLWLKPLFRTMLFWLFVGVELTLLVRYIGFPIFKYFGLKKGITDYEASVIIGNHFPEIKDKLLNMLQLKDVTTQTELIDASISQKSKEFRLIPFKKAINFSQNKKYLKYAVLPVFIWIGIYVFGAMDVFNQSFTRVVHYNTAYEQPAPFKFHILNESFSVVEMESFNLQVDVLGDVIPDAVKIYIGEESYYLKNNGDGRFEYFFERVKRPVSFYLESAGIQSQTFNLNVIEAPVIGSLKMILNYPTYTGKINEVVLNNGNTIVPQGTDITWQIETHRTNRVNFYSSDSVIELFDQNGDDYFSFSKRILKSLNYRISSSNAELSDYESLSYSIQVIKDEYPSIEVKSDIDSIRHGPVQFIGLLSDDYLVTKLNLVYYDKNKPKKKNAHRIDIVKGALVDFYYVFPDGISLEEGVSYELYFEVYDNDAIHGRKKTRSKVFRYYEKTQEERNNAISKEQKETLNKLSNSIQKVVETNDEIQLFKGEIQKKSTVNWNDSKKLEQFLQRQVKYDEMFQKQTDELQKNLTEPVDSERLNEMREDLKERIAETKKLNNKGALLKELQELSEKLDKENMTEKLNELMKKNKRNEQNLERILELTKRFYVEQKANQISEELIDLGEREEELSKQNENENSSEKQEAIHKEFEKIQKKMNQLNRDNRDLKRPMDIPSNDEDFKEVDAELNEASENLKNQKQQEAKKNQKKAGKKMKQMGKEMEMKMSSMGGESIDENIEDLRKIVENLLKYSFLQEDLLLNFSEVRNDHPEFPKYLREQQVLKEYFEHIDDSLYMLSLRLVKMGAGIQKEVSDVHYNIEASLENFSENRIEIGVSNQHFVLTAVNNLANQLSDLLESLMNASPSFGNGKGQGKGGGFQLPDIIKKQEGLMDKMNEGLKKGEGKGKEGGMGDEEMNGELYEIYKEQVKLRQLLEDAIGNQPNEKDGSSGEVIKEMVELEREMLEKGFSQKVVEEMQRITYELLKLEKARQEQGLDSDRKSDVSVQSFEKRTIRSLNLDKPYFNYNEILKRQSLPLRTVYKRKVQEYFKSEK